MFIPTILKMCACSVELSNSVIMLHKWRVLDNTTRLTKSRKVHWYIGCKYNISWTFAKRFNTITPQKYSDEKLPWCHIRDQLQKHQPPRFLCSQSEVIVHLTKRNGLMNVKQYYGIICLRAPTVPVPFMHEIWKKLLKPSFFWRCF